MKKVLQTMTAIVMIAVTIQIGFVTLYLMGLDRPVTNIVNQMLGITWY